jgi:choline-sulfatase
MADVTRKQFLSSGVFALTGPGTLAQVRQRGSGRPRNVLFLMSDQHQQKALGVLGDRYAHTPNLDALARGAVRFEEAYCTNPVCTPSRASLLTGLYTHNHRAYSNSTPWPFEIKTVAHHFSRAGYISGLIGKMHFVDAQTHGFDYRLGFNDWFQYLGPKTKMWADELGRRNSGSGMPQVENVWSDNYDPWRGVREKDGRRGSVNVGHVSAIAERDQFESFVARETIRFLKRFGNKQPFFLVSSYLKPHDPFMPAKRFAEMFPPGSVDLPGTYGKVDLSKVPKEIRQRIDFNRPTPELKDRELAKLRLRMYYANLAETDDCVGQVLQALRELDLEKDTIIVYTSDHGEMGGAHGLWSKFVFYEPSVCVPLIFRVPGMAHSNSRSRTPVSLAAMPATLLELCGLDVPSGLDEKSLVPLIREPERQPETTVYSEFALRSKRAKYMIRRGDWKYMFYVSDMPELYNLREDPLEMNNLALSKDYQSRADEMKGRLFDWHQPPELKL